MVGGGSPSSPGPAAASARPSPSIWPGAGFDVAIGARTMHEGEEREHSSTVARSDTRALPGSLDATGALIEQAGGRSLSVYLDLLDRTRSGSAVTTVLERWGRIDVLVNNGRYVGPGHMDQLLDTPVELIDRHLQANVMAPGHPDQARPPADDRPKRRCRDQSGLEFGGHRSPRAGRPRGLGPRLRHVQGRSPPDGRDPGRRARRPWHLRLQPEPRFHRHRADRHRHGRVRLRRRDRSAGRRRRCRRRLARHRLPTRASRNGSWVEAQDVCRELGLLPGWP